MHEEQEVVSVDGTEMLILLLWKKVSSSLSIVKILNLVWLVLTIK